MNPDKWVDEHGDYLFNYAISRVGDTLLAEDLVQDTFLSALKSYDNFKGKSSLRTWFISILKRKVIDHYRKVSKQDSIEGTSYDENVDTSDFQKKGLMKGQWVMDSAPGDWGENPEKAIEQKNFMDILKKCLAALPRRMAAVFTLREIEEIESDEVCKELDISASNLWVLLYRARTQLRHCLENNWFETTKEKE